MPAGFSSASVYHLMALPHSWALPCLCVPQLCVEHVHDCPVLLTVPRNGHEPRLHPYTQILSIRVHRSKSTHCRKHGQSDIEREARKGRVEKGNHLSGLKDKLALTGANMAEAAREPAP